MQDQYKGQYIHKQRDNTYTNNGTAGSANRAPEIHKDNKQIHRSATVHHI
jgi:hypothetical protein